MSLCFLFSSYLTSFLFLIGFYWSSSGFGNVFLEYIGFALLLFVLFGWFGLVSIGPRQVLAIFSLKICFCVFDWFLAVLAWFLLVLIRLW